MNALSKPLQKKLNTELKRFTRAFSKQADAVAPAPGEGLASFITSTQKDITALQAAEVTRIIAKLTDAERMEIVEETVRRNVLHAASQVLMSKMTRNLSEEGPDLGELLAGLFQAASPLPQPCGDPECESCGLRAGGDPKRN